MVTEGIFYSSRLNAPNDCSGNEVFRVIHPFHPLFGQEFTVLFSRSFGGEDYLFFQNKQNRDNRIPAYWTSLNPANPYVVISGGRSLFCPKNLLELVQLIKDLKVTARRTRRKSHK